MSCPVRIYVISITYILTGHFSSISFPPVLLKREFIHFLSLIPFPEVFAHFLLCEFHYGILRDAMDVYTLAEGIPFQNPYLIRCCCHGLSSPVWRQID
mgnify:CR=1 FL=1